MIPKFRRIFSRMDFVTDTYLDESIKNIERQRRGCGDTFLIRGPKTQVAYINNYYLFI